MRVVNLQDDARNLKISAGADRNRRKWELRVEDSRVVEVRGSWEKRKDSGGSVFYCHVGDETVPEEPFRCVCTRFVCKPSWET